MRPVDRERAAASHQAASRPAPARPPAVRGAAAAVLALQRAAGNRAVVALLQREELSSGLGDLGALVNTDIVAQARGQAAAEVAQATGQPVKPKRRSGSRGGAHGPSKVTPPGGRGRAPTNWMETLPPISNEDAASYLAGFARQEASSQPEAPNQQGWTLWVPRAGANRAPPPLPIEWNAGLGTRGLGTEPLIGNLYPGARRTAPFHEAYDFVQGGQFSELQGLYKSRGRPATYVGWRNEGGVGIQVKSLQNTLPRYTDNPNALFNELRKGVDDMANAGPTTRRVHVGEMSEFVDPSGKVLDVSLEKPPSPAQKLQLDYLQEYAAASDIQVVVRYPLLSGPSAAVVNEASGLMGALGEVNALIMPFTTYNELRWGYDPDSVISDPDIKDGTEYHGMFFTALKWRDRVYMLRSRGKTYVDPREPARPGQYSVPVGPPWEGEDRGDYL
jgi:hypothetical protein